MMVKIILYIKNPSALPFFKKILLLYFYLFIFFWLRWVFIAVHELSLVAAGGGYSLLWCVLSLQWLLLLLSTGSRRAGCSSCSSRALERRLSSCGARA